LVCDVLRLTALEERLQPQQIVVYLPYRVRPEQLGEGMPQRACDGRV
jgi:hypothetical protein